MSPFETFAWGFAGSVAVEVITLLGFYQARPMRIPRRYRRTGFWVTRVILAGLAGALAVGYGIEQRILAFNIGAATPLIISSLARGFRTLQDGPDPGLPSADDTPRAARSPFAGRQP
jgi:hypothetical protein